MRLYLVAVRVVRMQGFCSSGGGGGSRSSSEWSSSNVIMAAVGCIWLLCEWLGCKGSAAVEEEEEVDLALSGVAVM